MNYTQIQQFLVLSKTMNMTKAAKELYVTQPALSHALAKMEDELGLKLVYRDGDRLALTEEGRKIQKDFEAIVRAYDDMNAHASMMRENRTEKITLGFAGRSLRFPPCLPMESFRNFKESVFGKSLQNMILLTTCCKTDRLILQSPFRH